ncbi:MAG TPA: 4Fe-4S dicluster domain-containing protein [Clostridiales bacterium]|nr:4Fe-4S dicluster domain-containing protein [Clostridiales bacterium]
MDMNKTGFGFMRLPQKEEKIDFSLLCQMVDAFIKRGGTYFDTAYIYLDGESEEALKKTVVERYPRESFQIADKLPSWRIKSHEDCQRYFDEQLRRCGVTYFDVYLVHSLTEENYKVCEKTDQFAFVRKMKAEGKARQIGFSFHGSPELLEQILADHPEVDCVLLQINYLDWDSVSVQSRRCYEVAAKYGKRILVMEPVKGGTLAKLPEKAEALLRSFRPDWSIPSWAIRFVTSLEKVDIVLSGMNTLEQIYDNMQAFEPLTQEERECLAQTADIIRAGTAIQCTGCDYCTPNCPTGIPIPQFFKLFNEYSQSGEAGNLQEQYDALADAGSKASACIECSQCEQSCPQKLEITNLLKLTARAFG